MARKTKIKRGTAVMEDATRTVFKKTKKAIAKGKNAKGGT